MDAVLIRSSTPAGSGPYVITAMAFLRFYDLTHDTSRRWPAHLTGGVLCIDLTTPGTPVTSNRAHTRTFPVEPPNN